MLASRLSRASSRLINRRRFAAMPVPQSSLAKPFEGHPRGEGWESTMTWFYATSSVLLVAILGFAPETEIETWAKQEARVRLAMTDAGQGDFEFGVHYQNVAKEATKTKWDKFSLKSMRMTDDDDDDDEEEEEEEEDDDE